MLEPKVLWWQQYRKMMYKRPIKFTKERLFRTSLRKTLLECCRNSSIASFQYLFTTNNARILERASWIFMFILMGILSSVYLNTLRTNLISKPFIISTESTVHPIEKIDFPAVALCNINRISKRAVTALALRMLPKFTMFSLEELERVLAQSGLLINLDPETEEITKFISFFPINNLADVDVAAFMLNITPSCDKMLIRCSWNGFIYPCKELFTVCRTSHGHCCCFNYIKDNEMGRLDIKRENIKRQNLPGNHFGLSVLLDADVEDYCFPIRNAQGFDVLVFDSQHYPDHNTGFLVHQIVNVKRAMMMQLNSRIQIATEEFKRHPVDERKCLFRDERPKMFGNMYSYSSCILGCRIRAVFSLCKCVPYYFPKASNSTRACSLFDLKCLNKFKDKLYNIYPVNRQSDDGVEVELQNSMDCPECLPDCEFTKYNTKAISMPINVQEFHDRRYGHVLTRTINITNKSMIVVYSPTAHGILNKLDVVNYWFEFASIFGGSVALLLGFTLVTIAEVFYFLTLKLIIFMREKINEIRLRNYNY